MSYNNDELYHYGVLGMKWGIRKNKGKAYSRSVDKLKKYKKTSSKFQQKANKLYKKAESQSNSFLKSNREKGIKTFQKAGNKQAKVNRSMYRGMKWYRSMEQEFNKANFKIDPNTKKLGKEFIDYVNENSKQLYIISRYDKKWRKTSK